MFDRPSNLVNRLRLPFLAGIAGGVVAGTLVAGILVVAAFTWRDSVYEPQDPDPDEMAAAITQMSHGMVGKISGPRGSTIRMGFGRVAGRSDPNDGDWFWQQVEGLDPAMCVVIAKNYWAKPELVSLRIGPRKITPVEAIPTVCKAHATITVVLPFGETL